MNKPASQTVRFGVFEVDIAAGELPGGGTEIKLQDQPFEILRALLERPGEIVSREHLSQRIWRDDTFVDFNQDLSKAVSKVREVFPRKPDHERLDFG